MSVRNGLRIAGPALFGIGLILTVIAFADFFSAFNSVGASMPSNFFLAFIGLPLMAAGGWMIRVGYLGPATRYVAGEVAPTIKETLGYMGVGAA
ncbi:MAG: zinc ribbon domain-containing protein, partial [Candidatus Limnocylindria bacterium]